MCNICASGCEAADISCILQKLNMVPVATESVGDSKLNAARVAASSNQYVSRKVESD
jgi:hypothetical protein